MFFLKFMLSLYQTVLISKSDFCCTADPKIITADKKKMHFSAVFCLELRARLNKRTSQKANYEDRISLMWKEMQEIHVLSVYSQSV